MSILDGLRQSVLDGAERLMVAALEEARRQTAEAAPAPMTGDLNRSIQVDPPSTEGTTLTSTIRATANHASFTDSGTGIYAGGDVIRPRVAKALRFYWILGPQGSGIYYFAWVRGQPPQRWFMAPMADRWQASLEWASSVGAFGAA